VIDVGISRWAAWTPPAEADVSFLPPLLRRRCSRMTRAMLHVAFRVAAVDELATMPAVFGSRHGELSATVGLLETLARGQTLTAAGFSHSVHNAPAGLFSIAAKNRDATCAVAAGADTFGATFLEAVATMRRGGHERALIVVGDEVVPEAFGGFGIGPTEPYAVALLLGGDGARLSFRSGRGAVPIPGDVPQAIAFVRWLERGGETLTLGARTTWTWSRTA
jgi:hypothetical protein